MLGLHGKWWYFWLFQVSRKLSEEAGASLESAPFTVTFFPAQLRSALSQTLL